jgi:chemotaxis protein methyltransferase CheR
MTVLPGTDEVARFRSVVAHRLGLRLDAPGLPLLGEVLRRRLDVAGQPCEPYLEHLEAHPAPDEVSAVAEELTVAETYFFRDGNQFRALAQHALPDRMRAQAARKQLRILSAGCASGEEAYSLAILLRETITDPSWSASILAVDVNRTLLQKAASSRFSMWSLRETPAEVQHRWFRRDGREVVLDESVRAAVTFELRNLAEDDAELWRAGTYDVIFCRNVIMYFTQESGRALVARMARALAPGGYLFLGHAETLRGLSQEFHLRHTHGTFYYQREEHLRRPAWQESPETTAPGRMVSTPLPSRIDGAGTWAEAAWADVIRDATERIRRLTEAPSPGTVQGAAAPLDPGVRRWDLDLALDLLRQERFAEALGAIEALPSGSASDPDVLLLQAALLTHSGDLARAEGSCRRLLEIDELSAGAHYLLAVCREGAGDRGGAVDHHRAAVRLDPGFAMPRLHLGLIARRAGEYATMQRELGQAVALLQREDDARVLLFGGGFDRDALIALCRAELLPSGGKP